MSFSEAIKQIKTIFISKDRKWVDKIILKKRGLTKVYVKEKGN